MLVFYCKKFESIPKAMEITIGPYTYTVDVVVNFVMEQSLSFEDSFSTLYVTKMMTEPMSSDSVMEPWAVNCQMVHDAIVWNIKKIAHHPTICKPSRCGRQHPQVP